MYLFLIALHVVLCVSLIFVILVQPGKGGDMGAAFGGSSSVFGPRGPTSLLQRVTTGIAVTFMVTVIALTLASPRGGGVTGDDDWKHVKDGDSGDSGAADEGEEAPVDEEVPGDEEAPADDEPASDETP